MFRLRFAARGAAALVVLSCGCCNLCHRPFFGLGHHGAAPAECCDIEALPDVGVPAAGGCCNGAAPINPGFIPNTIPPQGPVPQMQPPPGDRLQPIPQAPRSPYAPSSLK
ncbi:MAG: hypothetical protein E6K70_02910 [Planctomycetota bacterium]|nr:MAG: hypothetical protein E6K70_02910 [Planctomycetota bacterium]